MKKRFCILIISVVLLISAYVFFWTNSIHIEASVTTYPFALEIWKDLLINNKQISMVATPDTFNDLVSGKADIIFVTVPNNEQQELLKHSEWDFELIPVSTENVVILVNKNNPLIDISSEDLNRIYTSNLKRSDFWWDLEPINSYQISINNGSATVFNKVISWNIIDEHHIETPYMDVLIDLLWNDKYWIWYAFYTFSNEMYRNNKLKIISIDGKSYNEDNYPLKSNIFLWYNKYNKKLSVVNFIKNFTYN